MRSMLGFDEIRNVFEKYGFPLQERGTAKTEADAIRIASEIGFPVVLKSLVQQNQSMFASPVLNSSEEVIKEFREILKKNGKDMDDLDMKNTPDILVQRFTVQGMEANVRMTRDPQLGPIVTFGLSGVFEFLKDVSYRIAPVSREEALKMIEEIKAYSIVKGGGKKSPSDISAIVDVIERVSKMSMENDDILEIDINPMFVYEKGAVIIDVGVVVG